MAIRRQVRSAINARALERLFDGHKLRFSRVLVDCDGLVAIHLGCRREEEPHVDGCGDEVFGFKAVAAYNDPAVIAEASRGLGEAMVGINVKDLPAPHRLSERGW